MCWVFVSMRGLSPVPERGGHSSSRCAGLSLSRPLLLRSTGSRRAGSVVMAHGPSRSAACGIFPDQGSEPVCPALAGRFLTTVPPGKPPGSLFIKERRKRLALLHPFLLLSAWHTGWSYGWQNGAVEGTWVFEDFMELQFPLGLPI